jgi:hypothetical protein
MKMKKVRVTIDTGYATATYVIDHEIPEDECDKASLDELVQDEIANRIDGYWEILD